MSECCRASSTGDNKQLFDTIKKLVALLEKRDSSAIVDDFSSPYRKSLYSKLLAQAERLKTLSD